MSFPVIIETYFSGTSGYRIWSPDTNGYKYCEQWGRATPAQNNNGTIDVTLLKEYINTNGICLVSSADVTFMSGGGINYGTSSAKFINTKTIRVKTATVSNEEKYKQWFTSGYIA
ncbi:MAG: hypothetical protein J6Q89_05555 [Clostridia bacterium]|nr:hypothetical protein [Clostridia bacterium]